MAIGRIQCVFPFFTNTAEDVWTNTLHFEADGAFFTNVNFDAVVARLDAFYTGIYGVTGHAASYVNWAAAQALCFDLGEPSPRVPYVVPMPIAAAVGNPTTPTEVACVLSYHAAPASGVVRQRLHNRIYLGGLGPNAMQAGSSTTFPTFQTGWINAVAANADTLLGANTGLLDWVQYSQAGGVEVVRPIVGGWVDNSPDTQRRRSVLASSRTLWP